MIHGLLFCALTNLGLNSCLMVSISEVGVSIPASALCVWSMYVLLGFSGKLHSPPPVQSQADWHLKIVCTK